MTQVTTYQNAPLIELIVELRWLVMTNTPPNAPPFVNNNSVTFDIWFNNFSTNLEKLGYHNIERLLPHDLPPIAYQPIFRYRKNRNISFPIIQFGHGIVTINAGPPDYISWNKFRPEVEKSIQALIDAKPKEDSPESFISVSIRYIDAFRDDLRDGLSNFIFMRDKLQSSIQLPVEILKLAKDENLIIPTMAIKFPIKDQEDSFLTLQIAAGEANKEPATIMEMHYNTQKEILMAKEHTLNILDSSHNTLHYVFETMTKYIQKEMKPVVEGGQ